MAGRTNRSKTPRGRVFSTKADDASAREVRADSEHRGAAHPSEENIRAEHKGEAETARPHQKGPRHLQGVRNKTNYTDTSDPITDTWVAAKTWLAKNELSQTTFP